MARRVAPSSPGLPGPLAAALLALRFATELALLAGAGFAAGARSRSVAVAALLGVVAAVAVAVVWGLWIAPASRRRLPDPLRLALEVVLFTGMAALLAGAHRTPAAVVLAVVGIGAAVAVRAVPSSRGA